jgi:hypothetical protein
VGEVIDVSEVHAPSVFFVDAACASKTSAILPTNTRYNNQRTELASIVIHNEILKSVGISLNLLQGKN